MTGCKIIIGVHGIGDQVRYETIQSIAYQFCRYYNIPAALPLGSFHNFQNDGLAEVTSGTNKLCFAEAYWADIAREPATDGYTLEETKQWARTIVRRFQARVDRYKNISTLEENKAPRSKFPEQENLYLERKDSGHDRVRVNYRMIRSVLYEAIDAVNVLEKLLFVSGKTGIFQFNLNSLLVNYLGDVQIVAEFEKYRSGIIDRLIATIGNAHKLHPDAEIYVISHSEGTVVSFLGLLEGMRQKLPWIANVRGLMTLGSPIDKHLALWPGLWKDYARLTCDDHLKGQIKWRNYYDRGDPVGYELDSAREWLRENCAAFEFPDSQDHGFSRYFFPGKAHVDYWKDDEIFDNFINGVVENKPAPGPVPEDNKLAQIACNTVPYIGISVLLMLSVYFLCNPLYDILGGTNKSIGQLFSTTAGTAAILAGITVMARIPRLTHQPFWTLSSIVAFASLGASSYFLFGNDTRDAINAFFGMNYLAVAAAAAIAVACIGYAYSSARSKPLMMIGGLVVLLPVVHVAFSNVHPASLWPVFAGGAVFIYGWWLSILLFDLVFIWHWYIRNSKALDRLRAINQPRRHHAA